MHFCEWALYLCLITGWYLYVSTKISTNHQKRATLVSEYMKGDKCLSLAYCMNGKNMGSLEFFTQDSKGQYSIFAKRKKGHQGKGWHDIQFSITNEKHSYRVSVSS